MKRKFLLAIIPALLALSSCGVKPSVKANPILEDNVAHEEIYGEAQEIGQLQVKKADRVTPLQPKIGVQYKRDGDNISLRYVAAISTLSVKAKWYRGLAMQDSNCPLKIYDKGAYVVKESTTAYEAVGVGDGNIITPPSVGGGYQYFVVYTLRNINYDTYKYSYIGAYLELTDENDVVLTTSDVVVASIDQQHHFSFSKNQFNGYFMEGTIHGEANNFEAINDVATTGNVAQKALNLKANDNFGIFKWTPTEFFYYGNSNFAYEKFYMQLDTSISTNYSKIKVTNDYTLYVNDQLKFGVEPDSYVIDLYLDTGVWDTNDNERYAIVSGSTWISMVSVTDQKLYKISNFDVTIYPSFYICRMNGGTSENNWNNAWNQTNEIWFEYDNGNPVENEFIIDDWDGNGHDAYNHELAGYHRAQYPAQ